MKKIIFIISLFFLFVVSIENKIVSADEIQEVLDQYSLTGEELDKFEENEQK